MLVENEDCTKMTICKKDDKPLHQKGRFFIASERVSLSLDI